jgi:hypothetical protein
MGYSNLNATPNYQLQAFGQRGFRQIDSSFISIDGEYYRAFLVVNDAVVSVTSEEGDNLSFVTLIAGTTIYGLFSSIAVQSGLVIAYIA